MEYAPELRDLLKRAGEPVRFDRLQEQSIKKFDNLSLLNPDMVDYVRHSFHEATGIYRVRLYECINPLYWVETAIFLPSTLVGYLGIPAASSIGRAANVVVWTSV
jgi:hypothetical protein